MFEDALSQGFEMLKDKKGGEGYKCNNDQFGKDPVVGRVKQCVCDPFNTVTKERIGLLNKAAESNKKIEEAEQEANFTKQESKTVNYVADLENKQAKAQYEVVDKAFAISKNRILKKYESALKHITRQYNVKLNKLNKHEKKKHDELKVMFDTINESHRRM